MGLDGSQDRTETASQRRLLAREGKETVHGARENSLQGRRERLREISFIVFNARRRGRAGTAGCKRGRGVVQAAATGVSPRVARDVCCASPLSSRRASGKEDAKALNVTETGYLPSRPNGRRRRPSGRPGRPTRANGTATSRRRAATWRRSCARWPARTACGCWSTGRRPRRRRAPPSATPPRSCRRATATSGCATPARSSRAVRAAPIALRFKTNSWGGKYELPDDATVGDDIARLAGRAGAPLRLRAGRRRRRP